jgi:2'-5' RNA ligase
MESTEQSAVIVTIPATEKAVAAQRAKYDKAAGWGVPAHVTVLYPFMTPANIDGSVIQALATVVASVPKFQATFERTGWFGTAVLWLDPEPTCAFQALTAAVANAFPAHQPYGGVHDVVIPHLTVGHDSPEARLREAEREVLPYLPIHSDICAASLWCGVDAPASWRQVTALPLG